MLYGRSVFFLTFSHPHIFWSRMGLENFDQNQNSGHWHAFQHPKKKFCPRPLLRPKKAVLCFSTIILSIWSISMANRVIILGMQSIPEFRYGSLPYTQIKIFAFYCRFLGVKVTFLPKILVSEWPYFLKIGLGGTKWEK